MNDTFRRIIHDGSLQCGDHVAPNELKKASFMLFHWLSLDGGYFLVSLKTSLSCEYGVRVGIALYANDGCASARRITTPVNVRI